jgi:hypothetical protein
MTEINDTILDRIRKVQGYLQSDNPNEAAVIMRRYQVFKGMSYWLEPPWLW